MATKLSATNEDKIADLEAQAQKLKEMPRVEGQVSRTNAMGREHEVYFEPPTRVQKRQEVAAQLRNNPALTLRDAVALAHAQLDNDGVLLVMIMVTQQLLKE